MEMCSLPQILFVIKCFYTYMYNILQLYKLCKLIIASELFRNRTITVPK